MKILFVSCLLPYPGVLHGGGTDLFHLIESLSQRHEIHLVSLVSEAELPHVREIESYCVSVKTVAPAWSWRQKARSAWLNVRRAPLSLGRRAQGQMRAFIRQTIIERNIDVVQFEWTETGRYLGAVPLPPSRAVRILDEVDVSFRPIAYRARSRLSADPKNDSIAPCGHPDGHAQHYLFCKALSYEVFGWALNPLERWQAVRAKDREVALCSRFDAILTRSECDRRALVECLPTARVEVLQPWTHVPCFADVTADERRRGRLLFVGAMDREENGWAAEYFCRQVFPQVKAHCPGAEFHIVGAHPPNWVRRLARETGVAVTGYVEDLRAAYAACDVFVAPIQVPGGIFNKIIDAMGAGRPVVMTPLGNEGLAAPIDRAVCVAETPSDFAAKTAALLQDDALWQRIAEGGRRYVQQVYRWEDNVSRLEALYERLISGGGQPRTP